jgi:hypothetical protein
LKQLAASLWITSLDKSVRTTCDKLVESTMLLQVVLKQTCCKLILSSQHQVVGTTCNKPVDDKV